MGNNSTRFIKYHEIIVNDTDLFEDAMRFNIDYHDVFKILGKVNISPNKKLNSRMMRSIRNEYEK